MNGPSAAFDWRALLKAIAWSLAFIFAGLFFSLAIASLLVVLAKPSGQSAFAWLSASLARQELIQGMSFLPGFLLATWLIGIKVLRLRLTDLRWRAPARPLRGLALGLAAGVLPAVAALLLAIVAGGARWVEDAGSAGDFFRVAGQTLLILAPAAFAEEVWFRGVPLVLFERVMGRGLALLLYSGLIFALVHARNPHITPLAVGNIALAGLLLGLAFYSPGGIWMALGAHLGWNATIAVSGAPVSGLPFDMPMLDYLPGGPAWLTGGDFGPEGGVLATLTITLTIIVLGRWVMRESR